MKILNKYSSMSVQAKAALWYTICNFLQKGIAFIVVPIYVRLLTPAEYGTWAVFQSWKEILIIFASLNLYCGVYTKSLVDIQDDRDRYTSSMQGLGTVITIGLFVLYLFFSQTVQTWLSLSSTAMYCLFFYFIVYPAVQFWSTRQRVEYKYKQMVVVTLFISVLTPAISVLLLTHTDLRAKAVIYGYLLVQSVFGASFYIYHFVKGKTFFYSKYWLYALNFNIPLIPHYLSLIVLGQADRIMIKYFCGESDAGIYSFAYSIGSALIVLMSAINGSLVPWSYEQLRDKVYDKLKQVTNLLCVFFAVITAIVTLISPEVVRFLGTSAYYEAVYVIPMVALGVYFTFCYNLFSTVEFYYSATRYVMVASCAGAILKIVLNVFVIPLFGFIAAAFTTLICYFMFMIMHYIFMKKVCRWEKISEDIFDIKTLAIISVFAFVVTFVCMLTYSIDILRYATVIMFCIAIIMFKERFIDALHTMKNK